MSKYVLIPLVFFCNFCFGQSREALWKRYQQGDLKYVLDQASQSADSGAAEMQLLIGRALTDSAEFDRAIPYLKNVVSARPSIDYQKAWGEAYLGVCMFATGDQKLSRILLMKCIDENITPSCSKFAAKRMALFGFTPQYRDFDTRTSGNFVFYFEPRAINKTDQETYIGRRQQAYDAISAFFGRKLKGKINYFSWASGSSLKEGTGSNSGFATPEYGIVHATINQTAGHEIAHLFVRSRRKSPLVNEGLAVYLDQDHGDLFSQAKQLLSNGNQTTVNIHEMWNMRDSYESKTFYKIAGAFVEELIKKAGKERFLKLVENQTLENAEKIYGSDFAKMVTDFETRINSI